MAAVPPDWLSALDPAVVAGALARVERHLAAAGPAEIYPPRGQIFSALARTPFAAVRAVILGQDPYHGEGEAHGLAFSVPQGVRLPPSLRNIFKELSADLGGDPPKAGDLGMWAEQGVLLLNTVLTVAKDQAASHAGIGWETLTDHLISRLSSGREGLIFVLWGNHAGKKAALIDRSRHEILTSPHPSPLSAHRGFFGSRPFSRINRWLESRGGRPVEW